MYDEVARDIRDDERNRIGGMPVGAYDIQAATRIHIVVCRSYRFRPPEITRSMMSCKRGNGCSI